MTCPPPEVGSELILGAWQTGKTTSFNEPSSLLQVDNNTVISYVTLLEQAYMEVRCMLMNSSGQS
jgi:predicted AAA+ superfamily ATPase